MIPASYFIGAFIPVALYAGWKKLNVHIEPKVFSELSDPYWSYSFDRFTDYSIVSMNAKTTRVVDFFAGDGWYGGGRWLPVPMTDGAYSPEVRSPKGVPPLLFICSENEKPNFCKHAAILIPELLNSKSFVVNLDYCSYGEQLMLLSLNEYHGYNLSFCGSWLFDTYYAPQNKIGNEYLLKTVPETVEGPGIRPTKHFLTFLNNLEDSTTMDGGKDSRLGKELMTDDLVGGVSNVTKVGAIAAGSLAAVAAIYLLSPSLCNQYIEKHPSSRANRLLELVSNCPTFITTHTKSYGVLYTDRGPRLVGRQILFSLLKKFKRYKIVGSETLFDIDWKGRLNEGAFISRNIANDGVIVFDKLYADRCEATLITDGEKFQVTLVV